MGASYQNQWEQDIKTNGSKTMAAGVPRYVFPMGARPWLLEYRAMCLYVILISDFPFTIIATMCWHYRHECISDDNEWEICFMRTWEITQILQFTVLTNVDVNGSQIVKVYCYWTMKCLNVLSLWKMHFHLPCQRNV